MELADEFFKLPVEEKLMWEMDKWGGMQIGGWVIQPAATRGLQDACKSER
jgi:isopenicillin N synthase-like dioxygenase